MTAEQLTDIAHDPIAMIFILAIVIFFICLWAICASAKIDESCYPEKSCSTCKRKADGLTYTCIECKQTAPYYPNWTPKEDD